jgi:hypothetical protein
MTTSITFDHIFKQMVKDYYVNEAEAIVRIPSVKKLADEWESEDRANVAGEFALECMRATFTDDDTMKYVTPERERRWGLDNEPEGWDSKYTFIGRSGGHLALTHFMGYDLTDDDWDKNLPEIPNRVIHRLCPMLEEIRYMVDHRDEELLFQLAFYMRYNMPEFVPQDD